MKKFGAIMLVFGLMTMGLVLVPSGSAPPSGIELSVGKYTGNVADYVPEEKIEIKIYGPDTETYDISIRDSSNSQKKNWDDRKPNEDGILSLDYEIPAAHADGWYTVYVCWGTAGTCDAFTPPLISISYWLQLWTIDIETDRGDEGAYYDWHDGSGNLEDGSYLPDEVVTVYYSITFRKDNMPVETNDGYLDWTAYDSTGANIDGKQDQRVSGLGMFSFDLSSSAPLSNSPGDEYRVYAYYNDTDGATPDNYDSDMEYFYVGSLGVEVSLPWGGTYEPGDQVMVEVMQFVDMGTSPNGIRDWGEAQYIPGTPLDPDISPAKMAINLYKLSAGDWDAEAQYDVSDLRPDDHGLVSYVFTLDSGIADDTDFKVDGTSSYVGVDQTSHNYFTVTITAGILRVNIKLDKFSYVSGDTVTATATVSTSGTSSMNIVYSFSVYEYVNVAYVFLDSQIGSNDTFQYQISDDFDGTLRFRVTAKNQDGVQDTDSITTDVYFGYLLVNVNQEEYVAGSTIQVTYEIIGSLTNQNPTFFYYIVDASGLIVDSNETTGGQFSYVIPSVPSDWYQFYVVAYVNGRTLAGMDNAYLVDGYFIQITFDKEIYSVGDTMKIQYTVVARGDSKLPSVFYLSYGITGNPKEDHQTDSASGEITYYLPSGMDEGTLIFSISESNTGATTTEVITVRAGNPLWWAKLAEIPAFSILLLILIIILFILLWRMRRAPPAPAPRGEAAPTEPEGEAPPPSGEEAGAAPAVAAATGPSPLSVPCKSCGGPIELTTSKRPIEVMCPSCGETQMVY